MPINASYEYYNAEGQYLKAQTTEEKVFWLEEMIKTAPKHKSSEHFVAELKTRLKKFKEKQEKSKKASKGKKGIRKEGFQCLLVGFPNSGKSSLLKTLTNANPLIASYPYTTKQPEIGTLEHHELKAQIIDLPALGSENFDFSLLHTTDLIILVVCSLEEFGNIQNKIPSQKNFLVVFNKSDLLNTEQRRKLEATLKTKKIPAIIVSSQNYENISELKSKIISKSSLIRIYTKEPGKEASKNPMILPQEITVKEAAEKIYKGFSAKIKITKITGPSAKFPNQKVGLKHVLKDKDIIEFQTK